MNSDAPLNPYRRIIPDEAMSLIDLVRRIRLAAYTAARYPGLARLDSDEYENKAHRREILVRPVQDISFNLRLIPVSSR
jgi:hypothetical protein